MWGESPILFRLLRWLSGKESACQCRRCRRPRLNPGSGRSPGEGNGNPLQHSSLEDSMDWGAWWNTVHGVAKSRTWLRIKSHHKSTWEPLKNRYTTIQMQQWGSRCITRPAEVWRLVGKLSQVTHGCWDKVLNYDDGHQDGQKTLEIFKR